MPLGCQILSTVACLSPRLSLYHLGCLSSHPGCLFLTSVACLSRGLISLSSDCRPHVWTIYSSIPGLYSWFKLLKCMIWYMTNIIVSWLGIGCNTWIFNIQHAIYVKFCFRMNNWILNISEIFRNQVHSWITLHGVIYTRWAIDVIVT